MADTEFPIVLASAYGETWHKHMRPGRYPMNDEEAAQQEVARLEAKVERLACENESLQETVTQNDVDLFIGRQVIQEQRARILKLESGQAFCDVLRVHRNLRARIVELESGETDAH